MPSELDAFLVSPNALAQTEPLSAGILRPGDTVDGLVTVALIGHGASCEVWRVHDPASGRDFALKLFNPTVSSDGSLRERFLSEARLLLSVRHPNVLRVHRVGEYQGRPFLTADLLRPLPEHLDERSVIALGLDLCRAIDCLHGIGVIHRDIKPDNILVAPDGHFVLADLGIAGIGSGDLSDFLRGKGARNLTLAGGCDRAIGTPGYAAPEQMAGDAPLPSADIHALGVLFDTLFNAHPPRRWKSLIRQMTSSLPSLRTVSTAQIRRKLIFFRCRLPILVGLATLPVVGLWAALFVMSKPTWRPLPAECTEVLYLHGVDGRPAPCVRVTLPTDGDYTRGDLIYPPTPWHDPKTGQTNDIPTQVVIRGPGRLYAPRVVGPEVHLISNAVLITDDPAF